MSQFENMVCLQDLANEMNLSPATVSKRIKLSNLPFIQDNFDDNKKYISREHVCFIQNFSMPRYIWRGGKRSCKSLQIDHI